MSIPKAFDLINTYSTVTVYPVKSLTALLRYLKQDRIVLALNKERLCLTNDGNLIVTDLNGAFGKPLRTINLSTWHVVEECWNIYNWKDRPRNKILLILE